MPLAVAAKPIPLREEGAEPVEEMAVHVLLGES